MLITCPSCASSYDLPADRIGATGRKVRCASCRESWFVASPENKPSARPSLDDAPDIAAEIEARPLPPVPPPSDEPEPAPPARAKSKARKRRSGPPKPAGTIRRLVGRAAAIIAIGAALPCLLAFRETVVSVMPGTASLYRAVGLPVNLVGLRFAEVRSTLSQDGETPVLEVSGEIVNEGRKARSVPWLQIALEGAKGDQLYSWSAKATEGELPVGQTAPFRVRLTAPPPDARRVEVTFREDRARRGAATH